MKKSIIHQVKTQKLLIGDLRSQLASMAAKVKDYEATEQNEFDRIDKVIILLVIFQFINLTIT